LKMAGSIDGRSALANGASQWITSAQARADGHRLRARAQALVTGVGTVIADDPQLTVRGVTMPQTQTQGESVVSPMPLRVVVDSQLKTPVSARILQGGCLIATASKDVNKRNRLEAAGAEVVVLPNEQDRVDLKALMSHLAARGMNEVHVEAGSRLSGVFLQEGLIDEIVLYMAPCLLGSDARGFFDGLNLTTLTEKLVFNYQDIRMVGPDLRIIVTPSV
jgi:diaminohydroxyphosphoribosylaminopyrimidine deaminase / 5-amino-6-(5-phosphoribosylamino)uracil reductase